MPLKRSNDRKVTVRQGTANAFGIPAGVTCPGMTTVCQSICYASRTETQYTNVARAMRHNLDELLNAGSIVGMSRLIRTMISEFAIESHRRNVDKAFRIHWDGDFFSREYAMAWASVVRAFPDIQFWAYTRSFIPGANVIDILADIPNLSLYLSVDRDNIEWAKIARNEFPSVKWAFLGETAESTKVDMLALNPRPGAICPENVKRIPLITDKVGACISCGLCVKGKVDVRFSITKQ